MQGTYVFTLKVTDDKGAATTSNVTITVNAALVANQPPTANAGANQTITLPQNSVTLSGSGADSDGTITSYRWSQLSGPSQTNIVSHSSPTTAVNALIQGSYVFTLKVTDEKGASATSNVTIIVNAAPNRLPFAKAGADQTITPPQNSVILMGSGSDPDGTIKSYQWHQVAGPSKANFMLATAAITSVNNLVEGDYVFQLMVTDNDGATALSNVNVSVKPNPRTKSTASVYPNPATSYINIQIDALTNRSSSSIRILNAAGKQVFYEEFIRNTTRLVKQLDISDLPGGAYFVFVTTDIHTNIALTLVKQ